ncbi:hypothetical protein AAHK20_04690 [Trinickia sp. YCB016]
MIHALIIASSTAVEAVLSFTGNAALPAAYYATLLEQTNVLLTALETAGAA